MNKSEQRYIYDPKKHQPISDYVTKICKTCGESFSRPGNWRKTNKCPHCASITQGFILAARKATAVLLKTVETPTACQKCGELTDYLEVHHTIPLESGGGPGLHNIEFLCHNCHTGRHRSEERE